MAEALVTGAVVQGYRIEEQLGRGGMGVVHRAVRQSDGLVCAIKAMHRELAHRASARKRLAREARAILAVDHPNIVRIHEVLEHEGVPMIVMELLHGKSLQAILEQEKRLPLDRLARILVAVASAVGTAHALGIVHRDLKPDNIFVGSDGSVRVLDFGIAKLTATQGAAAETAALTRTGTLMGTPFYMSPEQAFGEKKIDQRSDIWSLGIIMYRCLSGSLPTYGQTFGEVFRIVVEGDFKPLGEVVPTLPADVKELVARMLAKNPEDRPWDLREVHAVLARYGELSAPTFGKAVEPSWEDSTTDEGVALGETVPAEASASASPRSPIALTPSALRAGHTPPRYGAQGTLAMEPGDTPSPTSPSQPPAAAAKPSLPLVADGPTAPTQAPAERAWVVWAAAGGFLVVALAIAWFALR